MDFIIRPFCESDAASVCKYANNKKIADNLREGFPHPYTFADAESFISGCLSSGEDKQCIRAIEIEGEAAGSIGVFLKDGEYRKSAELGYWLGEPYWGKAVMRRAISEFCGYVFSCYDLVRIHALPYAYNQGSRKALEHAGFTLEGIARKGVWKNGMAIDSCVYSLIKE